MAQPESDFGARGLENVLAHHGVKGMKWGVRRSATQLASRAKGKVDEVVEGKKAKKTAKAAARSEDHLKVAALTEKSRELGRASLSNKELEAVIARKNLEVQYAKLNPTVIDRGISTIDKLMGQHTKFNTAVRNFQNTKALMNK